MHFAPLCVVSWEAVMRRKNPKNLTLRQLVVHGDLSDDDWSDEERSDEERFDETNPMSESEEREMEERAYADLMWEWQSKRQQFSFDAAIHFVFSLIGSLFGLYLNSDTVVRDFRITCQGENPEISDSEIRKFLAERERWSFGFDVDTHKPDFSFTTEFSAYLRKKNLVVCMKLCQMISYYLEGTPGCCQHLDRHSEMTILEMKCICHLCKTEIPFVSKLGSTFPGVYRADEETQVKNSDPQIIKCFLSSDFRCTMCRVIAIFRSLGVPRDVALMIVRSAGPFPNVSNASNASNVSNVSHNSLVQEEDEDEAEAEDEYEDDGDTIEDTLDLWSPPPIRCQKKSRLSKVRKHR